ncbi:MAG TPA: hypothetical protein VF691_21710, partial [Cytophagaceae bacterium]
MIDTLPPKFCLVVALIVLLFAPELRAQVTVRSDGVVQVNGRSFFPYGFYTDEKNDKKAMFNHAKITGEAGFNVLHIETINNDPLDSIFKLAALNNQHVIYGPSKYMVQYDGPTALHLVYDKVKNQPSLLGYNVGDDVNDGEMVGYPSSVADVKALHDDVNRYDPNHITMVALGGPGGQIDVFSAKRFDAGAQEVYPVNGGSEINLVYQSSSAIVENAIKWKQSPWVALQTFNWNTNPNQRMPTFKEYYNMLYQSIAAGAKGVLLYSYHVEDLGANSDPNLWNGIKSTVPEINKIKPFITDGKFTKTELG